jgi:hypothetical protein
MRVAVFMQTSGTKFGIKLLTSSDDKTFQKKVAISPQYVNLKPSCKNDSQLNVSLSSKNARKKQFCYIHTIGTLIS